MKTILHLIETSGPGGAENVLINLVDKLDKNKYKSLICLLKDGWLNAQLAKRRFETTILPHTRTLDFSWLYHAIRFIRARNVSLLHAHEFAMNTYSSMISSLVNIPCVATVHGKNYYTEKWRRKVAYRFVAKQSKMVAVSKDIKNFLLDQVHIDEAKVITIHNGIDVDQYLPRHEGRERTRRELGVDENRPVIGTIGNLYSVKGHRYLLKAALTVTEQYPDTVFLFAGRGQMLDELQSQARALGIYNNVRFLGFREDVADLLDGFDIFVLPSLSEGLPLSILEAMAANKPVVATNVGGIPEVVVDGETGLLVPPMDSAALANAMLTLLNDPGIARTFVEKGAERVTARFSVQAMVTEYERLYEKALN